jgi:hypothetical protein
MVSLSPRQEATRMASTSTRSGPRPYTKKTTEERAAAAAALRARLEQFDRELAPEQESEILAQFMGYSARNAKLIAMQAADLGFTATDVAGFHAWKDRGRKVDKRPEVVPEGFWGLKILAPAGNGKKGDRTANAVTPGDGPATLATDASKGEDGDRMFFHTATLFDISQTVPADADGQVSPTRAMVEARGTAFVNGDTAE